MFFRIREVVFVFYGFADTAVSVCAAEGGNALGTTREDMYVT
jgi:hypothetical protein